MTNTRAAVTGVYSPVSACQAIYTEHASDGE